MKKNLISSFCFVLFFSGLMFAQQSAAPAKFAIYEDIVKPSMDAQYKEGLKKLKAACDLHKADFSWTSVVYDDNTYAHLIPIKGFADLDKNMMAGLETKMGKEALGGIFTELEKCVESSSSFVATMLPDLSYLSPQTGENYRDIMFWEVLPGKEAEGEKLIMEWLNLYKSKNAPNGVLTYKVLFGRAPGYAFVHWGKSPLDLETKSQKSNELFGEEAGKLWAKTMTMTKKYYHRKAWVLPDFSKTLTTASN